MSQSWKERHRTVKDNLAEFDVNNPFLDQMFDLMHSTFVEVDSMVFEDVFGAVGQVEALEEP